MSTAYTPITSTLKLLYLQLLIALENRKDFKVDKRMGNSVAKEQKEQNYMHGKN